MTHDRGVRLDGKVAWVTGAARGMGATHSRRLAAAGAAVGCIDVDATGAEAVAAGIREAGGRAEAIAADVADWPAMRGAAAALEGRLGPVDIVVPNAGVLGPIGPTEDVDVDAWTRTLAVNLTGPFLTVRAAIPQLRGRGGSIVLMASVAGVRGWVGMIAYHASKHGVIGLMQSWANELAADGVRVNALCPGWVDTVMIDVQAEAAGLSRDEAERRWVKDHLLERFVRPEEVSEALVWLCSDSASMITGVALPVDGGTLVRTLPA